MRLFYLLLMRPASRASKDRSGISRDGGVLVHDSIDIRRSGASLLGLRSLFSSNYWCSLVTRIRRLDSGMDSGRGRGVLCRALGVGNTPHAKDWQQQLCKGAASADECFGARLELIGACGVLREVHSDHRSSNHGVLLAVGQ